MAIDRNKVRYRPAADIGQSENSGVEMGRYGRVVLLVVVAIGATAIACPVLAKASTDPICASLRTFAGSVKAGETRTVEFRTVWGGGSKGAEGFSLFETSCEHFDYAPGAAVCKSLMKHGNIEFSGNNPLRVITCLSTAFQVKQAYRLTRIDIEIPYGTDQRGSTVTIKFDEDKNVGGELLSITADGY